ncbi:MAG: carboxymuconolactone decarboxylase family protein [Gammaproteobacteria bacterium]|nr:carboxymuconolactone decarboxylase family protein [Gammaproteobacteria bacterium]
MIDRYEKGIKVMREHLGPDADKYVETIREVAPLFAKINVECAFGDVYGDPDSVLDQKQKELCTIAALTVMGCGLPQLKLHVGCALNCGASMKEIGEVITQMIMYCGFPAATNAILTAKEVFIEKGLLKK